MRIAVRHGWNGVNVPNLPKGKPQSHGRKSVVRGLPTLDTPNASR